MFQSTVGSVRRLTPPAADRSRADCPSLKERGTEKDFIDFVDCQSSFLPEGRSFKPIRNS